MMVRNVSLGGRIEGRPARRRAWDNDVNRLPVGWASHDSRSADDRFKVNMNPGTNPDGVTTFCKPVICDGGARVGGRCSSPPPAASL